AVAAGSLAGCAPAGCVPVGCAPAMLDAAAPAELAGGSAREGVPLHPSTPARRSTALRSKPFFMAVAMLAEKAVHASSVVEVGPAVAHPGGPTHRVTRVDLAA